MARLFFSLFLYVMLFYLARGCPNCGDIISDQRLAKGLPCPLCLPEEKELPKFKRLLNELKALNTLKDLKIYLEVEERVNRFQKIFKEIFQNSPSSLQINWAKRFFLGESFAILAPTGTGKTTFGLLACLLTRGRALVILPTKMLVTQALEKLINFRDKTKDRQIRKKEILAYQGTKKEKNLISEGKFDILIGTINFFHRNFELLNSLDFSLVFIDDVDSLLKSGKNVDQLFKLLGFTEEEIALALKRDKEEEDYKELQIIRNKHAKVHKQLILSSATLRPKTNRVILFQNLLGFEVTRFVSSLRKVEDTYLVEEEGKQKERSKEECLDLAAELCLRLGKGGLLFLEESFGREGVLEAEKLLQNRGINCASYLSLNEEELLEALKEGKIDIALGLSHLSNPLLRGIDLPFVLKYVIFVGVPKNLFPLSKEKGEIALDETPANLYHLLLNLLPLFTDEERIKVLSYLNYLKRFLTMKAEILPQYEGLHQKILSIKAFLEEKLRSPSFMEVLNQREDVYLYVDQEGKYYIVVGNAQVYLQGSGRVSRLTVNGLLPGLSIILVDSFKALRSLERRLKFYLGEEAEGFRAITIEEAPQILKKIQEERASLKRRTEDFKNYLLVVESPHKAKTIASFFGRPSLRRLNSLWVYEIPLENSLLSVCASLGHVFNLVKKRGIFGVKQENGHFYPIFDSIKLTKKEGEALVDDDIENSEEIFDKWQIIEDLRRMSYCVDGVFIASDPDAEGEKIAYDLFISLRPFQSWIKRLEFHEITPKALREALKNPQEFNLNRVCAQLARRVADRWVGFTLSQELWKAFHRQTLSAGRVQTPVLGWVIKRAEEAKENKYRIIFQLQGHKFSLDLEDEELAEKVYSELPEHLSLEIEKTIEEEVSPPPPFTTDAVLEEAYQYFKFSSAHTMNLLQELFEAGLITYHRTDSTRISEVGRYKVAKPYITQNFGEEYFLPREWPSPGAHEGIRPTNPWDVGELKLRVAHGLISLKQPKDSFRLYDLIFRRFMASQMEKAVVEKSILRFKLLSHQWTEEIVTNIKKKGFDLILNKLKVVPLEIKEKLKVEAIEKQKLPKVYLFNQGTLIQEMKRRDLGRPSTYAEIVSTLLARGYVIELKNGGLVPTSLGKKIYSYLVERYHNYVSEEFTRKLEEFMDKVEEGLISWDEICFTLLPLLKEGKIIP